MRLIVSYSLLLFFPESPTYWSKRVLVCNSKYRFSTERDFSGIWNNLLLNFLHNLFVFQQYVGRVASNLKLETFIYSLILAEFIGQLLIHAGTIHMVIFLIHLQTNLSVRYHGNWWRKELLIGKELKRI